MQICVSIPSDVSDLLKGTVEDNINSSIGQLTRSLDAVRKCTFITSVCTYVGAHNRIIIVHI